MYNCALNENVYTNLKKNKRFKKLKSTLASNKVDIYKILKCRSDGTNSEAEWNKKKRLIKKQVGNGVVGVFATLLSARILISHSSKLSLQNYVKISNSCFFDQTFRM